MKLSLNYRVLSRLYDVCDLLFFSRPGRSPRQALLGFLPDEPVHILDICAGTASNDILIAEQKSNATVVGIDNSKEMLSIARRKIAKKKLHGVNMLEMDAVKLEFAGCSFDVVIISLILHEMGKPLASKMLSEARRVVKPEGMILVVEWEQPQGLFQKCMFSIIKRLEFDNFEHFLKKDLKQYFKNHGFSIENVKHCDYTQILQLKVQ
ncbi:class I SAM-dependent methyltransferase [Paenibacillus sp. FSL R7-0179]|uniref:class I SAM-dependent methyltransferase n=1 Tax=Paenibacillus sp. FSL R7-0179 TaxID=2921672 RepID=UPI0030F804C5